MSDLVIETISHSFGSKKVVNCGYTHFRFGKVTGLIGRNGEGKSTLLNILYGKLKADYSRILFSNKLIKNIYKHNAVIAYLTQDSLLPYFLKVKKFIKLAAIKQEDKDIMFSRFKKHLNKTIGSLSSGERRLLEIHYILKLNYSFTFLDEPFKALEPKGISEVKELIKNSSKSIIISSHLFNDIQDILDETFLMRNGSLIKIDNYEELVNLGYLPELNHV